MAALSRDSCVFGVWIDTKAGAKPEIDGSGFAEFFSRCWGQVRWAVAMRAADDRFVDDEVQEAFLLARRAWAKLCHYDKPESWVIKVAWRRLTRVQERERRRAIGEAPMPVPDFAVRLSETDRVHAAIRLLAPRQAEVIILQLLGYSVAESAEMLAVSTGTVKSQLHHARARLRVLIEDDL